MKPTSKTRIVRLNQRRAANEGTRYTDQFVGMSAVITTHEGARLVGTVESITPGCSITIRFPDGRWATVVGQFETEN